MFKCHEGTKLSGHEYIVCIFSEVKRHEGTKMSGHEYIVCIFSEIECHEYIAYIVLFLFDRNGNA